MIVKSSNSTLTLPLISTNNHLSLPNRQSLVEINFQIITPFDPYTQPLEPIFIPKLQIYFADFPYLLSSIDQRLLTLET